MSPAPAVHAGAPLSVSAELGRKSIHLLSAVLPIAWAYELLEARDLRVVLSAAVAIALIVEFARYRGGAFGAAFTRTFGPLLRSHERQTISGATWLAIGMWSVVLLAPPLAGIAALWAAAVGDATAAVVGRLVQRWRTHPGAASGKSLVGAFAGGVATGAGILWLTPATLVVAAFLGVVAAVAEWPAGPGDDNIRVAGGVALAAVLVGLR